jgi:hypothetical protein
MLLLSTLALIAGCAAAPTPRPAGETVPAACQTFAQPFVLVAQQRDGGKSKQRQLNDVLMINSDNLSTEDQAAEQVTLHWTTVAVEFVYSHRELSPEAIRQYVLARCSVDKDGKVVYAGE